MRVPHLLFSLKNTIQSFQFKFYELQIRDVMLYAKSSILNYRYTLIPKNNAHVKKYQRIQTK